MSVIPFSPMGTWSIGDGPIPNIQPFTYGDALTFLDIQENMRDIINSLTTSQNNCITAVNADTANFNSIKDEIATMNANYGSLQPLDAASYYTGQTVTPSGAPSDAGVVRGGFSQVASVIAALQASVNTNTNNVSANTTAITSKADQTALQNQITQEQNDVTGINNNIASINTILGQKANQSDLTSQVDKEAADVTNLQNAINLKADQTALQAQITQETNDVATLNTAINARALQSDLTTQINKEAADVASLNTAVQARALQTDLQAQITKETNDIAGVNTTLAGKANTSDLTTVQGQVATLQNPPTARAIRTSDYTMTTTAAYEAIPFDSESYDKFPSGSSEQHDAVNNPSKLIARVAGTYAFGYNIEIDAGASAQTVQVAVFLNNSLYGAYQTKNFSGLATFTGSDEVSMSVNDNLMVQVSCASAPGTIKGSIGVSNFRFRYVSA